MREYILEVKKLIPQVFCEKIISYFDNNYEQASIAVVGEKEKADKDIRNCLSRSVLRTKTLGEKICSTAIKSKIFNCVAHYEKKYSIGISKITQLDILKYETNEHKAGFSFHTDFGSECSDRHLSISICLNNEYEGGEFVFKFPNESEFTLPQNTGDAVIFPSNFMFPHQVNKITKGTRYALIGWVV
tara:strand:+ start:29 stop:589 length:561 start_codon:yes stop_codon:yes gene_type:complete